MKYEIVYVIKPNIDQETKEKLIERFQTILVNNSAEIIESKSWGKRRLAYGIKGFFEGIYQVIKVSAVQNSNAISEFNRLAKINNCIIRHMITKQVN